MRKRTEIAIWSLVVVASLGLHAVAFGGLGTRRIDGAGSGSKKARPTTLVEMSMASPKESPPPEAPKSVVKSAPRVAMARPARATTASPPPSAPPPPSAAPPPADESPADFTGVTMTNDGPGAGWSSATGNGHTMNGPVGRPGAHVGPGNLEGDPAGSVRRVGPPGPPVVGIADLSAAPTAPDLVDVLARAYPPVARARGVGGKAVVRARVMPDGAVRELALLSESGSGFGAACRETLRGSRWSPPMDRAGHAVSTFINYTCRFNVQ